MRDRDQVEKTLRLHPALAPLLTEMKAQISKHFPEAQRLILAPEWESPANLAVRVVTQMEDTIAGLERFDDAWTYPRWGQHKVRLLLAVLAPLHQKRCCGWR